MSAIAMKPASKRRSTPLGIIDIAPVRREIVSAEEFLQLTKDSPFAVARSRYVAPTIGERGFGRFEVEYSVPRLKPTSDK